MLDRFFMGSRKSFFWEEMKQEDLWYLVGLITSDGSLSKDERHIDITSKERTFLDTVKDRLKIRASIGIKTNGAGAVSYRIQIGSKSFYSFLLNLGLIRNKSNRLGHLNILRDYFKDFLRGLIDGDGCIRKWSGENNFNQWNLKISSGSKDFLKWLNNNIECYFGAKGRIYFERNKNNGACYYLKICKLVALRSILAACYAGEDVLALTRKRKQAFDLLGDL